MIRRAAVLLALLLACWSLGAQSITDTEEYRIFSSQAKEYSVLFRGRRMTVYNFAHNGNNFWRTPEFKQGELLYNGKLYSGVYLNLDACAHDLVVKLNSSTMPVSIDWRAVEYADFDGRHHVQLKGTPKSRSVKIFPGLYEELYNNGETAVYRKIVKAVTTDTGEHNGDGIGYDDPNYRMEILTYFKNNEHYYSVVKGVIQKIGKAKAKKLMNGRK